MKYKIVLANVETRHKRSLLTHFGLTAGDSLSRRDVEVRLGTVRSNGYSTDAIYVGSHVYLACHPQRKEWFRDPRGPPYKCILLREAKRFLRVEFTAIEEEGGLPYRVDQGYYLHQHPAVRIIEERFASVVPRHLAHLCRIALLSANAAERRLAYLLLGYGQGRGDSLRTLFQGVFDPSWECRHEAVASLLPLAYVFPEKIPLRSMCNLLSARCSPVIIKTLALLQILVARTKRPDKVHAALESCKARLEELALWRTPNIGPPARDLLRSIARMTLSQ